MFIAVKKYRAVHFLYCFLCITIFAQNSFAQDIPVVTDAEKFPTDYVYTPIKYKGFRIEPILATSTLHNNNIYATNTDTKQDFILSLKPTLLIEKDFANSSLFTSISGEVQTYNKFSDENRQNISVNTAYENDIAHDISAKISAGYEKMARQREDPTGLNASSEPLYIETTSLSAEVKKTFNRLSLILLGRYDNIENENGVAASDANIPVIYDIDNRDQYSAELTALYNLVPSGDVGSLAEKALYLKTRTAKHDYEEQANTNVSRDRTHYGALLGFIGKFKGISLSTDIGVGYRIQAFADNSIKDTSEVDFYAKAKYVLDPKHIISFNADRSISEDNAFIEGIVETDFLLQSDYELLNDLYIKSQLGYEINDYEDDRQDTDIIGGAALRYLITPRMSAHAGVTYTTRDSSIQNEEFDRTTLMLQLTGRL